MKIRDDLVTWARRTRRDGVTLWMASKHPLTPWYARALGLLIVAYALSPIDLIPDFIPVLGYLDDLLLLPALIWLAIRLLPAPLLDECRFQADAWIARKQPKPINWAGAVLVVSIWIGVLAASWAFFARHWH